MDTAHRVLMIAKPQLKPTKNTKVHCDIELCDYSKLLVFRFGKFLTLFYLIAIHFVGIKLCTCIKILLLVLCYSYITVRV